MKIVLLPSSFFFILIRIIALFVVLSPVRARDDDREYGNPEIDAAFTACSNIDAKKARIYLLMLRPPLDCQVNQAQTPPVDPATKEYKDRYANVLEKLTSESQGVEICGYLVISCFESVPAASAAYKASILRALEDNTGKMAEKLPEPVVDASMAVSGDGRVPQDIDALPSHANENTRLKGLLDIYKRKTRLPDQIIDRILQDRSQAVRLSVASYLYLNDKQIDRILDSKDKEWIGQLVTNQIAKMNWSHVSRVIDLRIIEFDRQLARRATLSQNEARQLYKRGDQEIRLRLATRYQFGSVVEEVAEIVRSGPEQRILSVVSWLNPIPSEIVDLLLQHPSDSVRTSLTMNGKFDPTPSQIEKIL